MMTNISMLTQFPICTLTLMEDKLQIFNRIFNPRVPSSLRTMPILTKTIYLTKKIFSCN